MRLFCSLYRFPRFGKVLLESLEQLVVMFYELFLVFDDSLLALDDLV